MKKKILLFPGEKFNFNRNLLPYNVFGYNKDTSKSDIKNNFLISKKSSLIDLTNKKNENALYIGKFYFPAIDDVIIGTITQKLYDQYKIDICSSRDASLGTIEFEGATKKTKPNLNVGDLVFAKVVRDNKFDSVTLTCKAEDNMKNWSSGESTFGQLIGGNVYDINRLYAWKLINDEKIVSRLKNDCDFEMCIGLNGKIWINAEKEDDNDKVFYVIEEYITKKRSMDKIEKLMNDLFNYQMEIK